MWAPQQKFTPAFVNGLLSHTEGERAAAAWLLLAKIASCSPKLNYGTILDTWENTIRSENRAKEVTGIFIYFFFWEPHSKHSKCTNCYGIKKKDHRICSFVLII